MLEQNKGKVKIVFKNFPLRRHKYAVKAAKAALAAERQGKFWQFHDRLFFNYNRINDDKIREIATGLRLDQTEFKKQMNSTQIMSRIEGDILEGTQAGVKSVPAIFINGRLLRNRTLKAFQILIDKELKKLKKAAEKPKP